MFTSKNVTFYFSLFFIAFTNCSAKKCLNVEVEKLELDSVDGASDVTLSYKKTGKAKFELSLELNLMKTLDESSKIRVEGLHNIFLPLFASISLGQAFDNPDVKKILKKCSTIGDLPLNPGKYTATNCVLNFESLLPAGILTDLVLGDSRGAAQIRDSDGDNVITGSFHVMISKEKC